MSNKMRVLLFVLMCGLLLVSWGGIKAQSPDTDGTTPAGEWWTFLQLSDLIPRFHATANVDSAEFGSDLVASGRQTKEGDQEDREILVPAHGIGDGRYFPDGPASVVDLQKSTTVAERGDEPGVAQAVPETLRAAEPVGLFELECDDADHWIVPSQNSPQIMKVPKSLGGEVLPLNWGLFPSTTTREETLERLWERNADLLNFPTPVKALAAGDFLGNGKSDLVVATTDSGNLFLLPGDGDCNFRTPEVVAENEVREGTDFPTLLANQFEIFTVRNGVESIVEALNEGDIHDDLRGEFASNGISFPAYSGCAETVDQDTWLISKDDPEDENDDCPVPKYRAEKSDNRLEIYLHLELDLATLKLRTEDYKKWETPLKVLGRDVTQNGRLDIIVAEAQTARDGWGGIRVLRNEGRGEFTDLWSEEDGVLVRVAEESKLELLAEDFDTDGKTDLIVMGSEEFVFMKGDGSGGFEETDKRGTAEQPRDALVADVTGSSYLDLIIANENNVTVWQGQGDGSFASAQVFHQEGAPVSLALAERNADGRLDLVVLDGSGERNDNPAPAVYVSDKAGNFVPWRPRGALGAVATLPQGDGEVDALSVARAPAQGERIFEIREIDGEVIRSTSRLLTEDAYPPAMLFAEGVDPADDKPKTLVIPDSGQGTLSWLSPDDGNFASGSREEVTVSEATSVRSAAVSSMPDEEQYLAVADYGTATVHVGQVSSRSRTTEPPSYESLWEYDTGRQPITIEAGRFLDAHDAEEDLAPDFAVLNLADETVTTYVARHYNGPQSPEPFRKRAFSVGSLPADMVGGDFNDDGLTDLAVANYGANSVTVLWSNGDGTFRTTEIETNGRGPISLAVGSFSQLCSEDESAGPDLAVAHYVSSEIEVLQNQGDRQFESCALREDLLDRHVAELIDEEGTTKAISCSDCSIENGNLFVPHGPVELVTGSFEQADRTDIAIAVEYSGQERPGLFLVRAGPPDNGHNPDQACQEPNSPLIADFTGDGINDILGTCQGSKNEGGERTSVAFLFQGRGEGRFQEVDEVHEFRNEHGLSALIADQLDGNAPLDLAIAHAGSNSVSLLFGRGEGTFKAEADHLDDANEMGHIPIALASADFDRDAHVDIAVACQSSHDLRVFCGDGDGAYEHCQTVPLGESFSPTDLAAAYVDDNATPDLIVGGVDSQAEVDAVRVYLNDNDSPSDFTAPDDPVAVGASPQAMAMGDFNADGNEDLAVASLRSSSQGETLTLLLGDGQGGFSNRQDIRLEGNLLDVAVGDFNEDGDVDLAAVAQGPDRVWVLLSGGGDAPLYGARQTLGAGEAPVAVAVGNIDGDGYADLVVANEWSNDLTLFQGLGDGTFRRSTLTLEAD